MNNSQDILLALQAAWAPRLRVLYESHLGSTNTYLKDQARIGELCGPTLLFCGWQTAGRGTRGRSWLQPPPPEPGRLRDIALSYAVQLPPELLKDPRLSLAIGVVAAEALQAALPATDLRICTKWPNDLLVESRGDFKKAGGILLETTLGWLVAGIGINVNSKTAQFPPELQPRIATLSEVLPAAAEGGELNLLPLLKALATGLAGQLHGGMDLSACLERWRQLDRSTGQRYLLQRSGEAVEVTACGVTAAGLLRCAAADQTVYEVQSYTELEQR